MVGLRRCWFESVRCAGPLEVSGGTAVVRPAPPSWTTTALTWVPVWAPPSTETPRVLWGGIMPPLGTTLLGAQVGSVSCHAKFVNSVEPSSNHSCLVVHFLFYFVVPFSLSFQALDFLHCDCLPGP